jgi:maltose/maltodextrin transport system permease protein
MMLCSGLLKAIPGRPVRGLGHRRRRAADQLLQDHRASDRKPLTPLLISAFAFNFNNFVLISLLTDGRPDFLNTKLPAGTTDILVSYTYRIAFTDSRRRTSAWPRRSRR